MNKIFKMDLYRLGHSKVFYVSICFLILMAVGQILGGMSTTLNGLMGIVEAGGGEDFMAMAMGAGIINILLSIIIAIFVSGDYSSGFAKNIFSVHSNSKDYFGGKMILMGAVSCFMLLFYTVVCVVALNVLGYEVVLTGGLIGFITFFVEKWLVSWALCGVVLLAAVFTRNMAWTIFVGFLIATGGLTMGIAMFAQAFHLEFLKVIFSVLISGAAKICTMTFEPIILVRVTVTCVVWLLAAYICGVKVLHTKDIS